MLQTNERNHPYNSVKIVTKFEGAKGYERNIKRYRKKFSKVKKSKQNKMKQSYEKNIAEEDNWKITIIKFDDKKGS